jgi:hypothetical protein
MIRSYRDKDTDRLAAGEKVRQWERSGATRFAPGGDFTGYIGSCFDITDFRHAQEEAFDRQKLESLHVLTRRVAQILITSLAASWRMRNSLRSIWRKVRLPGKRSSELRPWSFAPPRS